MVAGDVADCEDLEEFADVVAVAHAGLLGIVQSVEDVCGLAFRELAVVSRCYAEYSFREAMYSHLSCSGRQSSL